MLTLFYLGLIFVLGTFMAWLSPKIGLPKVVGYLLLGLIIGPEVFGVIPEDFRQDTEIVIDLSLSLIAVLVGANLKYSTLKGMGNQILSITFFEATFAFLFVSIGLYIFSDFLILPKEKSLVIAILFGGLAAATAPAAAIAVVHELKAKGKFTSILLAVVASDDALALIFFTFAIILGGISLVNGNAPISISISVLLDIFNIIILSAIVGTIGAIISEMVDRIFGHNKGMETISTIGMVFIVFSLSNYWQLEPILATLVMGCTMANISSDFDLVEEEIDNHLVEIIFMLFFILSAMHLEFSALETMPLLIFSYILLRFLGKICGVWLGSKITKADKNVQTYLGLGLFPQAGVAIGLALSLQYHAGFESIAPMIMNVIIATTVVHELFGPILIKYILRKTGESSE